MARTRPRKSPEAIKQEVEELTNGMEEKVATHFHSKDQMKEYLRFMGQFHNYSRNNVQLMQLQFPGAEAVGSYKFWKDKGFPVQKGEKGFKILVPQRLGDQFQNEEGTWKPVKYATKNENSHIEDGHLPKRDGRLVFSTGSVFDISQTSATRDDLPALFPNKWMEGKVEDYGQLRQGMEAIAKENGIAIVEPKQELGAAKGVSYTLTKEVALNPRNDERQDVKTLVHELAHAKLHTAETHHQYSQPEKEFQAEMTAYTVASHFGVDTSDYSLDYLTSWTKNRTFDDHQQLLKEVQDTSHQFITTMERTLDKPPEKDQPRDKEETKGDDSMIHQTKRQTNEREQFEKAPITAQYQNNRSMHPEEREKPMPAHQESPLRAYRNEMTAHERNASPKDDKTTEHQAFKDLYKREVMGVIEPEQFEKAPITAQYQNNRPMHPEERENPTATRQESPLLKAYRNEVTAHDRNASPFEKEDKNADHQSFKDLYKREIMNMIEPGVGKQLDREESGDRQERVKRMQAFEKEHDPHTVYQLKKESLQEIKELPLSEQGQKRLNSLEKQLDEEYGKDQEKTSTKGAERSNERERREQNEPVATSSISTGTQTNIKGPEPDV
ncbi:ImmA/IrrE family metallo-endopeptidase [Salicibibacter cibarius]|uniref:ImmA/IrrE family metallo-endopeptidase n=2 Tax=Salicibibacter TaxID=2685905 RepID=A0A514LJJ5_9BACI|nr:MULTISPECIES: ImmA/IrrE family metallo-endopeptidase [Salicibibacter]QDI92029.1 ImmA/IrrE family metallo-endopeptidase [Salicibibacter halophilus]QQK74564.1 ImmA/IrrE family metallo-endopeptidase [Salicibibacter cibarius]